MCVLSRAGREKEREIQKLWGETNKGTDWGSFRSCDVWEMSPGFPIFFFYFLIRCFHKYSSDYENKCSRSNGALLLPQFLTGLWRIPVNADYVGVKSFHSTYSSIANIWDILSFLPFVQVSLKCTFQVHILCVTQHCISEQRMKWWNENLMKYSLIFQSLWKGWLFFNFIFWLENN